MRVSVGPADRNDTSADGHSHRALWHSNLARCTLFQYWKIIERHRASNWPSELAARIFDAELERRFRNTPQWENRRPKTQENKVVPPKGNDYPKCAILTLCVWRFECWPLRPTRRPSSIRFSEPSYVTNTIGSANRIDRL